MHLEFGESGGHMLMLVVDFRRKYICDLDVDSFAELGVC